MAVFIYHVTKSVRHQQYGAERGWGIVNKEQFIKEGTKPPFWFWDINQDNPLDILFDGPFWVTMFFVLSGFVLTIGFFKERDYTILVKGMFKRYTRLLIPV